MGKLSFDQLTDLYVLISVDRIGPAKVRNLLAKFKHISNILEANISDLMETDGISKELASRIRKSSLNKDSTRKQLEKELKFLDKIGGRVITVWDNEFPQLLKKIYDPPIILYLMGNFDEMDKYSVAVVGTRQPTTYGKIQTEKIVAPGTAKRTTCTVCQPTSPG